MWTRARRSNASHHTSKTRDHGVWIRHIAELKGDSAVRDIQSLPDSGTSTQPMSSMISWKETRGEAIIVTDVASIKCGKRSTTNNQPRTLITSGGLHDGFALPARLREICQPIPKSGRRGRWRIPDDMSELATNRPGENQHQDRIINNGYLGMFVSAGIFLRQRYVATRWSPPDLRRSPIFRHPRERITKRAEVLPTIRSAPRIRRKPSDRTSASSRKIPSTPWFAAGVPERHIRRPNNPLLKRRLSHRRNREKHANTLSRTSENKPASSTASLPCSAPGHQY